MLKILLYDMMLNSLVRLTQVQLNNERDMKEQKEKEKADFHLYTTIKVGFLF